jgi:hypothetical protein
MEKALEQFLLGVRMTSGEWLSRSRFQAAHTKLGGRPTLPRVSASKPLSLDQN